MSKGCQNAYENSEYYLHISDVLLYVTFFGTTSSSASFEWTALFFWEFIGAARVDGRISKVTKRARCSKAEPEGEKSLRGLKSLQLWYVIMPGYRQTEINKRLGKKLQIRDYEIMTTKGRNNLCGEEGGGVGKEERGEGEKEEGISWFSKIILFQWTANEGGWGGGRSHKNISEPYACWGRVLASESVLAWLNLNS